MVAAPLLGIGKGVDWFGALLDRGIPGLTTAAIPPAFSVFSFCSASPASLSTPWSLFRLLLLHRL